jgi:hypothetical protein
VTLVQQVIAHFRTSTLPVARSAHHVMSVAFYN